MPAEPYRYICVNADGSARELYEGERFYLETEFTGGDGAMPYIKDCYEERDGWGEISGYMLRARLPKDVAVGPAPAEDPCKPRSREETIAFLRAKGCEVVENSDGSMTILGKIPDKPHG